MSGVGDKLAVRFIAEIGDVRRLRNVNHWLPVPEFTVRLISRISLLAKIEEYPDAVLLFRTKLVMK